MKTPPIRIGIDLKGQSSLCRRFPDPGGIAFSVGFDEIHVTQGVVDLFVPGDDESPVERAIYAVCLFVQVGAAEGPGPEGVAVLVGADEDHIRL